jgi:hypothetical protein
MLAGAEPQVIRQAVKAVLSLPRAWNPPPEYLETQVSATVVKVLLGYDYCHAS